MNFIADFFLFLNSLFYSPTVYEKIDVEDKYSTFLQTSTQLKKQISEDLHLYSQSCLPREEDGKDIFHFIISGARRATKQEARYLLVDTLEKIVHALNQNEKLRPYLTKYPIEEHEITITLKCQNPEGFRYNDGSIELATIEKGHVQYLYRSLSYKGFILESEEPLEMTKKIVHGNSLGYSLKEHKAAPFEQALSPYYRSLSPFQYWMMGVRFEGFGAKTANEISKMEFRFCKKGDTSLHKARSIMLYLLRDCQHKTSNDLALQKHLPPQEGKKIPIDIELIMQNDVGGVAQGVSKVLYKDSILYYFFFEGGIENLLYTEEISKAWKKEQTINKLLI